MPISDVSRGPRLQLATPRSSEITRPALTDAQRSRVDQYRIDRSHFVHYPLPLWCPDGEVGDAYVTTIHRATTITQRIAAWRGLFQLTVR